jgi:archaetidylinositol phosphate synthase
MLNKLRPRLKKYIDPLAKKIAIDPNIITIIGLLVSVVAAYQFSQQDLLGGALLILLSGFFDVADGAVARNHGLRTKFGGILDSTADRFSDAFIIIGIILGGYVDLIWGVLALLASFSVSYVRARAEVDGVQCDVGVAERAERLMILVVGALLAYFLDMDFIMTLSVYVVLVLGYFTVAQRLYHSYKQLNS